MLVRLKLPYQTTRVCSLSVTVKHTREMTSGIHAATEKDKYGPQRLASELSLLPHILTDAHPCLSS